MKIFKDYLNEVLQEKEKDFSLPDLQALNEHNMDFIYNIVSVKYNKKVETNWKTNTDNDVFFWVDSAYLVKLKMFPRYISHPRVDYFGVVHQTDGGLHQMILKFSNDTFRFYDDYPVGKVQDFSSLIKAVQKLMP